MTFLADTAQRVLLMTLLWLCLACIDSAFVAWLARVDIRLAAAIVAQAWAAVAVMVDAEAIDAPGVVGHITMRALLYPLLAVQVAIVCAVLGG